MPPPWRDPPLVTCRGHCGRRRRTWDDAWICRWCLLDERQASPEPFRATRRRLAGRCVSCGGPWPDGSGCEFCPAVDEPEELGMAITPERGYGHAQALMAKSEQPGKLRAVPELREKEVRR